MLHAICYAVNYAVQRQDERLQLFHKLSRPPAPGNGSFVRCGGRMLERPQAGIPVLQHRLCRAALELETFLLPPFGFSLPRSMKTGSKAWLQTSCFALPPCIATQVTSAYSPAPATWILTDSAQYSLLALAKQFPLQITPQN